RRVPIDRSWTFRLLGLFLRSLLAKTLAGNSNEGNIDRNSVHSIPTRPMPLPSAEITTLLKAWRGGDNQALERLTPVGLRAPAKARPSVRPQGATGGSAGCDVAGAPSIRSTGAKSVDWKD